MKLYILLIMFLSISFSSFSQIGYSFSYSPNTYGIKTPKGANIVSLKLNEVYYEGNTYSDYPNEYKVAFREDFENNPNNAKKEVKGDVTAKYNCHSYAWNLIEGGTINNWIDAYNSPPSIAQNLTKYWGTDGGYTEVSNRNNAIKIYYSDGDHSAAITTQHSDTVVSKWGRELLVKHHYLDCPYTLTNIKYYKLSTPAISSTSTGALCSNVQRTYESGFIETDFTYNWNYTSPLDEVSDDDNPTYTVKGTSQNGQGTVNLTVTTPSGATATTTKNVYVGKPDPDDIDVINMGPNYPGSEVLCDDMPNDGKVAWNLAGSILEYSWEVYDDGSNYWQVNQHPMDPFADIPMKDVQFSKPYGSVNGYVNVIVKARNTCEWGNYGAAMQFSTSSCGGMYMMMSPNPSSGETTISIESGTPEETALKSASAETTFDDNTEWEYEVYSTMQNLKAKKTKIRGKSTKLNTQSWKEGVYTVRAKYKGEVLTGKLVVKK